MVAAGRRDDVPVAGDLPGEAGDGARDYGLIIRPSPCAVRPARLHTLVDLAEEGYPWEAPGEDGVGQSFATGANRAPGSTYALGYCGRVGWKRKIPAVE